MNDLLTMDYHKSRHGMVLYDHIGTIQMLVDGRLQFEIDLSSKLAGVRFTGASYMMGLRTEDREAGFWKWKRGILLRKETNGFPGLRSSKKE
jgi:hypothetical protein